MVTIDKLGSYLLGPNDTVENGIYVGDCRILSNDIPDDSVDFIITDPPYPREYLYLFEWLAITSKRILKPGGLLITLTGNAFFDLVFGSLNRHLDFYWIGGMKHAEGQVNRFHPKQILCGWKPALWFCKGKFRKHPYIFDIFQGKRDKRFHKWGQGASWFSYYIHKLSTEEDIIFDPFCGGGTVPETCKLLGRKYLAFEIAAGAAQEARQRVSGVTPLFTLRYEQFSMDFRGS